MMVSRCLSRQVEIGDSAEITYDPILVVCLQQFQRIDIRFVGPLNTENNKLLGRGGFRGASRKIDRYY